MSSVIAQVVRHLNLGDSLPEGVELKPEGDLLIVIKNTPGKTICCGVLTKRSEGYAISGVSAIHSGTGWHIIK